MAPVQGSFRIYSLTGIDEHTSKDFWTTATRDCSWLMGHVRVHSQFQVLYVYYPMHKWASLVLAPLGYDAGDRIIEKRTAAESSQV